jgi:hypothetical protein
MKDKLKIDVGRVDRCMFQAVHRLRGGPNGRKFIIVRFSDLDT